MSSETLWVVLSDGGQPTEDIYFLESAAPELRRQGERLNALSLHVLLALLGCMAERFYVNIQAPIYCFAALCLALGYAGWSIIAMLLVTLPI